MNRQFVTDGLYGDCLPSGAWCVLIPKRHCVTHLGIVPFPTNELYGPLFLRATDINGFRFAGQAHDTINPACWERDGWTWVPYNQPCVGVSPVIYDLDGVLHRSDGSVGSQGYRFVTPQNVIVSGDQTYGPLNGLFEYTYLQDSLWIGQGAEDGSGIRVWDGVTLRQLETGNCRFLRANRVDDAVALAFTRPEGVVLIQTTMAELRALPPVVTPVVPAPMPIPPVPPLPPEPPQPKPKPVPPKEPVVSLPSLDTWINVEYPQLVAAFTEAWGHGPDHQWAAFQTYRRYMEPDVWPFAVMLRHERSQNGHQPPAPVNPQ